MSTIIGLQTWDYVVVCILVLMSFAIGVYQVYKVRNSKNTSEFLVRTSNVGLLPITFSAIASQVSATGIMGNSAEVYKHGIVYMETAITALLIIPIGVYLYLPLIYNLKSNSIFKYLEYRFNHHVSYGAAVIDTFMKLLLASICAYAPAVALNQVSGLHIWASVSVIGVTCIIYTSLGGIRAVIWTDVAQLAIMVSVLFVIIIKSVVDLGGFSEIWRIAEDGERTSFFPNSNYFYTPWTTIGGCGFHFLGLMITNNMFMQRYLARPNLKEVRIAYAGTCCGFSLVIFITTLIGFLMYAKFSNCDPLLNGDVLSRDQTAAFFAMKTLLFINGLPGVFVAGVLCATLSTFSSLLNAVVVVTIEDFVRPKFPAILEKDVLKLSKILVIAFGTVAIGLVGVVEMVPGIMQAVYSFQGTFIGPLFGVFTAGMLLPWVNARGVITGYVTACAFIFWPTIGIMVNKPNIPTRPFSTEGCNSTLQTILEFASNASMTSVKETIEEEPFNLYSFSPLMYFFWSFSIVLIVGLLTSIMFGSNDPEDVNPKLIFPFVLKLVFKLPKCIQNWLGYKTDEDIFFKKWEKDSDDNGHFILRDSQKLDNGQTKNGNMGLESARLIYPHFAVPPSYKSVGEFETGKSSYNCMDS